MISALISRFTGLQVAYIERLAHTASHRYKSYKIPKRTGGARIIDHPSRPLKFLQRWLVDNIFSRLPVHDAAYSYRTGLSIKDHATIHLKYKYLLRVDFQNFFPSVRGADVRLLLTKHSSLLPFQLRGSDYPLILSLVCKNDRLTIGAPSSPSISNAILYDFDRHWSMLCKKNHIVYTRYADDLYFSTNRPNVLRPLFSQLEEYLASMNSPRLSLNEAKTEFTSRKRKCVVTGLVLTPTRKISIGREKKRMIKSLVYSFQRGILREDRYSHLKGYLAFVNSVEPSFIRSLEEKFGSEVLDQITHGA